jgi:PilZ domain
MGMRNRFTPGTKARNVMKEPAAAAGVTTKPRLEDYYRWVEPESNITVCLKLETVDSLQLAVLRGIDSFSHAGNEVGGILLGRTELDDDRILVFVDDFEPLPCEHGNGRFYALTAGDALQFEAALAQCSARRPRSVVGYYRSHNRDGLFLSKDDLQLIQRHFCEPDNLFLLIKTLPSRACTAGFFFRKNGHVQSEYTDSEVPLIPVSVSSAGSSLSLRERAEHAVPPESLTVVSPPIPAARQPDDVREMPAAIEAVPPLPPAGVRGRSRKPETREQNYQNKTGTPPVLPASKGESPEKTWLGIRRFRVEQPKSDSDRRQGRREPGDGLVAFYWDGGLPRRHRVRDISWRGAYVETDFSWMCGTLMILTFQIGSDGEPGNGPPDTIAVPAKVVRTSNEGMGVKFSLSDISERRRLLEFLTRWNPNMPQLLLEKCKRS